VAYLTHLVKGCFPENWLLVHYDSLDESNLGGGSFIGVKVDRPALGREAIKAVFKLLDHSTAKDVTVATSKEQIIEMSINGSGVRDIARVLKISPATVIEELKKKNQQCTM
jgi:DNA-binding NarL/FixJ family response regulator